MSASRLAELAALAIAAASVTASADVRVLRVPSYSPWHVTSPAPPVASDTVVEETLRGLIESGTHPYLKWADFPDCREGLEALYETRGFGLLWFRNGRPTGPAREAVDALLDAESHGLSPDDYDAGRLSELLGAVDPDIVDEPDLALLDGAISIGMLRFMESLHRGRVNPVNLHLGFNLAPSKLDMVNLLGAAIERGEVQETLARIAPPFREYERLREVLAEYRELAALDLPTLQEGPAIHPDEDFGAAAELRVLLTALGDLPAGSPPGPVASYDRVLVAGVRHFQARHGLDEDGVIGRATLAQLNTPISHRIQQIELALERMRWLTDLEDEPRVIVNIPAFDLRVVDPSEQDSGVVLRMRVVVGSALDKQTPAFRSDVRYIEFSPYWNIPYGIAVREILPAVTRNPGYLDGHAMEIVRDFSWGAEALPQTDENIAAVRSGRLNLRQRPGPENSLGGAKFVFPNSMNIYMHGTPAYQLFARSRRDFSHGCIRLEDPAALAAWMLRDQAKWTAESIDRAMRDGSPVRADLIRPVPVVLFYTTAVANEGPPRFYQDIYRHDGHLAAALSVGYPYPP